MGYTLPPRALEQLVQQQLSQMQQQRINNVVNNIVQTLWAISIMGAWHSDNKQQQQQQGDQREGCQQKVLQVCSRLSEPGAWQHLRQVELGQLACVHLWLGGTYTWRDTGALWECFSKEQMLSILKARKQITWAMQVVKQSKRVASAELEAVTADGLFGVDITAKTFDGRSLAIEYDGPSHYSVAVNFIANCAGSSIDKDSNVTSSNSRECQKPHQNLLLPNRATLFRNSALAARGYHVVCVPFYNWPDKSLQAQRRQFVDQLLAE
eukprot:gene2090-2408_t